MKKIIFFILLSGVIFIGCKKETQPKVEIQFTEKLEFTELRHSTEDSFIIVDDFLTQSTVVLFKGRPIIETQWESGIYSGPIIETRLLWAKTISNCNLIIIGFDDLFYEKLYIIKSEKTINIRDIGIIELLDAGITSEGSALWLKYNNSWTRTGLIADEEVKINL